MVEGATAALDGAPFREAVTFWGARAFDEEAAAWPTACAVAAARWLAARSDGAGGDACRQGGGRRGRRIGDGGGFGADAVFVVVDRSIGDRSVGRHAADAEAALFEEGLGNLYPFALGATAFDLEAGVHQFGDVGVAAGG